MPLQRPQWPSVNGRAPDMAAFADVGSRTLPKISCGTTSIAPPPGAALTWTPTAGAPAISIVTSPSGRAASVRRTPLAVPAAERTDLHVDHRARSMTFATVAAAVRDTSTFRLTEAVTGHRRALEPDAHAWRAQEPRSAALDSGEDEVAEPATVSR